MWEEDYWWRHLLCLSLDAVCEKMGAYDCRVMRGIWDLSHLCCSSLLESRPVRTLNHSWLHANSKCKRLECLNDGSRCGFWCLESRSLGRRYCLDQRQIVRWIDWSSWQCWVERNREGSGERMWGRWWGQRNRDPGKTAEMKKRDSQCTYNVILRRVRVTTVVVERD
jgi:hypothetical protein